MIITDKDIGLCLAKILEYFPQLKDKFSKIVINFKRTEGVPAGLYNPQVGVIVIFIRRILKDVKENKIKIKNKGQFLDVVTSVILHEVLHSLGFAEEDKVHEQMNLMAGDKHLQIPIV